MAGKPDPRTVEALASRIAALETQLRSVTSELGVAREVYQLVGHEVRTPLTVVLGVLSTLEAADLPDAERQRLQARALAHARRLRDVVDALLDGDPPARVRVPRETVEAAGCE